MKMYSDLHRHLDGSIRPSTLVELARERNLIVPNDLHFQPGMGLEEALSKFAFTLSLIQNPKEVKRVACEIVEDAVFDDVSTLEIRFAPQLHKGARIEDIVDAALEGIDDRAGLILCGLYGESPAVLNGLVETAKTRSGVVGIDLAGAPSDLSDMLVYEEAFKKARDIGLGRTCHASEGRNPQEIRVAIERLGCNRIGHGTTVLEDKDVVDLVFKNNVTIEACISSNVHVGAINCVADHPLVKWLELGIKCCVNTDNTLLSRTTSTEEHKMAKLLRGMNSKYFEQLSLNGHQSAFKR